MQFSWSEHVDKLTIDSWTYSRHRWVEAPSPETEVPTLSKLWWGLIWVCSCWVRRRQALASSVATRLRTTMENDFLRRQISQTSYYWRETSEPYWMINVGTRSIGDDFPALMFAVDVLPRLSSAADLTWCFRWVEHEWIITSTRSRFSTKLADHNFDPLAWSR